MCVSSHCTWGVFSGAVVGSGGNIVVTLSEIQCEAEPTRSTSPTEA